MKIIIDISEDYYKDIQSRDWKNTIWADEVTRAIHEGTVLSEHHGDLPSVTPKPKTDALDKIRAEIVHLHDWAFDRDGVLKIIDKYISGKAESEEVSE